MLESAVFGRVRLGHMGRLYRSHVLRAKSHSQHARRYPAQDGEPLQQSKGQRELPNFVMRLTAQSQCRTNQTPVREHLQALRHMRRKRAALLHFAQLRIAHRSAQQCSRQNICRRNRILNREVNVPTPPTGDIACAESPRHSSPLRHHCRR
jgi:hypothetical protein